MVERFFWRKRSSSSGQQEAADPSDANPPLILISGPPSSGKTSLLFQYAFNCAEAAPPPTTTTNEQQKPSVVFICNRDRIQTKPPFLSQGLDPSSQVFHNIQMKYVNDIQGLNNYFAAFHLHDTFPISVIVDDFGDFFDDSYCQERYNSARGRDLALVRTLALCHNAIIHANKTGPCKLLLSDTHHGDLPRLLYIYKRWVSSIYTIKGDGSRSFFLKNIYSGPMNLELQRIKTAKYSIALQYLVLEGLNEDMESDN